MVVDMLTSSQEQIPPRVTQMEEDDPSSPSALCANRHPHLPLASVHHRSDDLGSPTTSRRLKTLRMNPSDGANSSDRDRTESHEVRDGSRHRQPEDKGARSCKRKLELPSLSLGSHDATAAQDDEKKDPESPPPAKKWVIGPLFQSFKSKMASFTEIVMSPARLFKPTELPAESSNEDPSITDGQEDELSEKVVPVEKLPVVQRLHSLSDTEQKKVTILQDGSDHRQGSTSEDDGSLGSLNSPSTRRTTSNQITEALNVQQHSREEKQDCKSMNLCLLRCSVLMERTDSVRTSLNKGSGSDCAVQKCVVSKRPTLDKLKTSTKQADERKGHEQDQPLAKNVRLLTPAIGKRKKARLPERREVMEKQADQLEDSPTVMQIKPLEKQMLSQIGTRRKLQASGECLGTFISGDAQISDLNSSEKEKTGQVRASRSRSKKDKVVETKLVYLDIMGSTSDTTKSASVEFIDTNDSTPPSSGSLKWSSSRTTRQRKNHRAHDEGKPEITESRCGDPAEGLRSFNSTSDSKPQRNSIRQAKHKSDISVMQEEKKTRVAKKTRVKRAADAFEDQGMSMSLTLKVGSGLDGEKNASSVMTCGISTQMGEEAMLSGASCPTAPEDRCCVKDDKLTNLNGDNVTKRRDKRKRSCVYKERKEAKEEVDQEDDSKPGLKSSDCGSNWLKRSFSCPDITSLQHNNDALVNDKTISHPSPKKAPHFNANIPSPFKRTRRHTVCSDEIEREIAPLCLRKEVYPKWGSTLNNTYPHSPSKTMGCLMTCFLSSPLAFLSRKSSRGHSDDSGYGASSSDLVSIASSSSPSPPSRNSPICSSTTNRSAFFADASHTPEQSSASSCCSVYDALSMADGGVVQQGREETEQKAVSDSELKNDIKQMERRKVSSIRIRKTLPKPQYNLTPMGLPKAVRIKKKVFSVEEIYTNKNFTKPPEGRLETIFEVPISRRDGSESLIGPKRVKRFVEFPELGVPRKLRKPLVGGAGGGGAQRKAAVNSGMGRTRRCREGEMLHLQDIDSLLYSKLNELDVWMATEQLVY